jgi:hypothetical protein
VLGSSFVQAHSLVLASAVLPFLGLGLGGAPIPWPRPRRCSHSSALEVLPFLGIGLGNAPIPRRWPRPRWFFGVGLGGAPIPWRRPRPRWWSSSIPRRRLGGPPRPHLGAPHEIFGPASVFRTKPSDSPRWCSSSAPCLCLDAPHETFGLASAVLLLGSSASLLSVRFWLIVECRVNTSDSHLHSSLFILSFFFSCFHSIFAFFRFFIRLLQNTK